MITVKHLQFICPLFIGNQQFLLRKFSSLLLVSAASSNTKSPIDDNVKETSNTQDVNIYDLDEKGKVDTTNNSKDTGLNEFPVSSNGACPYCYSTNVVYIILSDNEDDDKLPELLSRLKRDGKAETHVKGKIEKFM